MAILTGAIIKALFTCAATEKMRFALNGVHVMPTATGTRLEATDGRRLVRLDLPTNGTGIGFITPEHAKAMKAGDVVTINGDELTIHGAFPITTKLAGSDFGSFPDTQSIVADVAPWRPKDGQEAKDYGYNPELLAGISAAFSAILSEPTVALTLNGAKPARFYAKGMAVSAKHEAAQRAAQQIGMKNEFPEVGMVEITAMLMPLSLK